MCIYRIIINLRPARARYATADAYYRRPITVSGGNTSGFWTDSAAAELAHRNDRCPRSRLHFHDDDRFVAEFACIPGSVHIIARVVRCITYYIYILPTYQLVHGHGTV